jgi:hypothetical protein
MAAPESQGVPEAEELEALVGRVVNWIVPSRNNPGAQEQMTVICKTHSARAQFGRKEVLIQPVEGSGRRWVSADSVEFIG